MMHGPDPVPEPYDVRCGCHIDCAIVKGKRTMTLRACRHDCPFVTKAVVDAKAIGLPVTRIFDLVIVTQP